MVKYALALIVALALGALAMIALDAVSVSEDVSTLTSVAIAGCTLGIMWHWQDWRHRSGK